MDEFERIWPAVAEALELSGERSESSKKQCETALRQAIAKGRLTGFEFRVLGEFAPALWRHFEGGPASVYRNLPISFDEFAKSFSTGS